MSCNKWNERLTERLYGEISPESDAALAAHLESCEGCRTTLDEFQRVRTVLRESEPTLPRVPRVVVLRDRARFRPALLAASLLGAAVLAGAGAGAGYAWGRGRIPAVPAAAAMDPAVSQASTEETVRREVARLLAASNTSQPATAGKAAGKVSGEPVLTSSELRAELAKFERRMNGARTADVDYVLDQIAASETRIGDRLGKTNQALRTVALASNRGANEQ
jgi:hypothetical protein